jgi:hypothetical protein
MAMGLRQAMNALLQTWADGQAILIQSSERTTTAATSQAIVCGLRALSRTGILDARGLSIIKAGNGYSLTWRRRKESVSVFLRIELTLAGKLIER